MCHSNNRSCCGGFVFFRLAGCIKTLFDIVASIISVDYDETDLRRFNFVSVQGVAGLRRVISGSDSRLPYQGLMKARCSPLCTPWQVPLVLRAPWFEIDVFEVFSDVSMFFCNRGFRYKQSCIPTLQSYLKLFLLNKFPLFHMNPI